MSMSSKSTYFNQSFGTWKSKIFNFFLYFFWVNFLNFQLRLKMSNDLFFFFWRSNYFYDLKLPLNIYTLYAFNCLCWGICINQMIYNAIQPIVYIQIIVLKSLLWNVFKLCNNIWCMFLCICMVFCEFCYFVY